MKNRQNGFTIVELLIVIVVIAILVAISIVAYNGIQDRARSAKTQSAVNTYQKAFALYAADHNGDFPPTTSSPQVYFACLGTDYPSNNCYNDGGAHYSTDATLNNSLKDYISNMPTPGIPTSRKFDGIVYSPKLTSQVNGVYAMRKTTTDTTYYSTAWLIYVIDAGDTNTPCPIGPVASYQSSGNHFTQTPPANGQTTNGTSIQNATCWIPLNPIP